MGVYCDDEKIFLARLADTLETAEFNFEIDAADNSPAIFQLAEKIKFICQKNGWKISRVGLVLRDGAAVTLQTDLKNVPAAEIASAVKTWAVVHAQNNARYTSIQNGELIWMEALPASIVEEYLSAFEKNSLQLCALTEIPPALNDERPLTPFNRAVFAADIVKNKKSPNLLTVKNSTWNIKKISLTAAAIFLIALSGFSAKLANDYYSAADRAKIVQERLNTQNDKLVMKDTFNAATAEIKRFNALIVAQDINSQNLNTLIKIGKIPASQIVVEKIKTSNETLELEGAAESQEAVKVYLNRLKNSVSPKVKLKSSTEIDGQIFFSISINFAAN